MQPNFEFDSEEVRYSHRFQPFTAVSTPPYIHYNQYRVGSIVSCSHSLPLGIIIGI